MSKLKPEQVVEMAELREQGWSYARLATRYGVTATAIHYRCLTVGALSPRSQCIRNPAERGEGRGFGGRVRHFTSEEDERLLAMRRDGSGIEAIGAALGRARTSVRIRLLTLELKQELA